jgi:glycosyltransferase involved in cell wall biosynthesis
MMKVADNIVLAFDGRAFCRGFDSMDRVLRVLVGAARHAGWGVEIWTDGPPRPDAAAFAPWMRPAQDGGADGSRAAALWSPDTGVLPARVPRVATLHDVNPLLADGRRPLARWLRRRRFRRRVHGCLARAERLAADTADAARRVTRAFPAARGRISVVPLFVDAAMTPLRGAEGRRRLQALGLEPGFILFVGSLRRHKNWAGLVRAYAALPAPLRARHALVLAGRARRARPEALRLAARLGVGDRVCLPGMVDETALRALYGGAHLLACPSFMEGFGFPPLEAMTCGVPVVASDRTCLPEVLGEAAVFVDPGSIASMAEGLREVLEDRSRSDALVAAGLARAAAFHPGRTAAAMAEVLEQLPG